MDSSNGNVETVGRRIQRLRMAAGLSQRDLSSPGVSYAYISRIEAGARTPSVKALRHLAPKLGVSVQYLETGDTGPVEEGCAAAKLHLRDLTEDELASVQKAADAWARVGAYEATLRVLDARERVELGRLEREAELIRTRRSIFAR